MCFKSCETKCKHWLFVLLFVRGDIACVCCFCFFCLLLFLFVFGVCVVVFYVLYFYGYFDLLFLFFLLSCSSITEFRRNGYYCTVNIVA